MTKISRLPKPDESDLFVPQAAVLIAFTNLEGETLLLPAGDHAYYGRYPTIVGFSVHRHFRDFYRGIYETRGFSVNVPDKRLEEAVRVCQREIGCRDLFRRVGLTPCPAKEVKAPLVEECIVNVECELRHSLWVGEYDFILGEVVMTHIDPIYNAENQNILWTRYPEVQTS